MVLTGLPEKLKENGVMVSAEMEFQTVLKSKNFRLASLAENLIHVTMIMVSLLIAKQTLLLNE